jgi:RimJ/RimL family protein N-acetyltransferase
MAADDVELKVFALYPIDDWEAQVVELHHLIHRRDLERLSWFTDEPPYSLRKFLAFINDQKALFVVMNGADVAGAFWISDVVSGRQCEFTGWIPFAYRGGSSEEICLTALDYIHDILKIPRIFLRSPWGTAHSLCERLGLRLVAVLHDYYVGERRCTLRTYESSR